MESCPRDLNSNIHSSCHMQKYVILTSISSARSVSAMNLHDLQVWCSQLKMQSRVETLTEYFTFSMMPPPWYVHACNIAQLVSAWNYKCKWYQTSLLAHGMISCMTRFREQFKTSLRLPDEGNCKTSFSANEQGGATPATFHRMKPKSHTTLTGSNR